MKSQEYLDIATDYYENKRYGEAIDLLERALKKYPNDTDILLLLSGCYMEITRFIDAIKILLFADKIEPNDASISYNLGFALLCAGRLDDCYKYLKKCLECNPPKEIKKMATRMLNSSEEFKSKLEKSESITLEDELEKYDNFTKAQKSLYAKEYDRALALYNRILEKNPNHHPSIMNIGVAYIMQDEFEKALPFLERAYDIKPNDPMSIINLAHAHYFLGNKDKANKYIQELKQKLKEPILRDLIRIITALIKMKEFDFAKSLLKSLEYRNPQLTFLSGVLFAIQKEYKKAKKRFSVLMEFDEVSEEYYNAITKLEEGKIKEFDFEPRNIIEGSIEVL